jgi:hypothetical protein
VLSYVLLTLALCLTDNQYYHQLSVRGLFGDADVNNQADGSW